MSEDTCRADYFRTVTGFAILKWEYLGKNYSLEFSRGSVAASGQCDSWMENEWDLYCGKKRVCGRKMGKEDKTHLLSGRAKASAVAVAALKTFRRWSEKRPGDFQAPCDSAHYGALLSTALQHGPKITQAKMNKALAEEKKRVRTILNARKRLAKLESGT